jgi:hypothetical protein
MKRILGTFVVIAVLVVFAYWFIGQVPHAMEVQQRFYNEAPVQAGK